MSYRSIVTFPVLCAGVLLLATACVAGSPTPKSSQATAVAAAPAAIAPSDPATAKMEESFRSFSGGWMQKLERAQAQNHAKAPSGRYKGYEPDFKIQLKPTGHAAAPYVGILRYRELTYDCSKRVAGGACAVASSSGVMEIFRFQGGRWVY